MSQSPNLSPQALYDQRLDSGELRPDPVQEEAITSLQRLYEEVMTAHKAKPKNWFERVTGLASRAAEAPKGIYMYGGVGRGKSMVMDLFFEALPIAIKKRRVHFHQFMIEVHEYIHSRRQDDGIREGVDAVLPMLAERIAERSRILCFDEFHVVDVADAMILGRLFTALFDRDVIVVTTSNWEPDRLYEGGLQRDRFLPFIELIKKRMEVVKLDSETDYRALCLKSEGAYFHPLGRTTLVKVNEVFAKLTDHAVCYSEKLEVKGHKIPVNQVAKGVARFTFADLCERPYGAEDFLLIAERYRTVFLENIPKLGYDRRNEAKRLMILIDALYETGTKLVISADALPDKLYIGEDHAFEFERTVSRLLEMQSKEYIERS